MHIDLEGVKCTEVNPVGVIRPAIGDVLAKSVRCIGSLLGQRVCIRECWITDGVSERLALGGRTKTIVRELDRGLKFVVPAGVKTIATVLAVPERLPLLVPELATLVDIIHEIFVFELATLHSEILFSEEFLFGGGDVSEKSCSENEAHYFYFGQSFFDYKRYFSTRLLYGSI